MMMKYLRAAAMTAALLLPMSAYAADVPADGSVDGLKATFVEVNGVRTRYYDYGKGTETILLVHGEGFSGHSSANSWAKNIPGLAQNFRVLAVDKLASGMTGNPLNDKDYNLEGEVEHMYQFIKQVNPGGKVHIVGQSRGGILVLFLAALHPDVVKTLIIVNSRNASPATTGETGRAEALAKCPKPSDQVERDIEEWSCRMKAMSYLPDVAFDDAFFQAGHYMSTLPKAQETLAKMDAGAGEPLRSALEETKAKLHQRIKTEDLLMMPTLLYWGIEDPNNIKNGPPALAGLLLYDVIKEKNPRTRMFIATRTGHFHFREYPEEFNYNIASFINYWNAHPKTTPETGFK